MGLGVIMRFDLHYASHVNNKDGRNLSSYTYNLANGNSAPFPHSFHSSLMKRTDFIFQPIGSIMAR